jgi:CheY-like chemotaxis protein
MNGIDSSRAIRALELERGQKPAMIIALTGIASATAQQEAFSSGINMFLVKPVRFSALRNILNNWKPNEEYAGIQGMASI